MSGAVVRHRSGARRAPQQRRSGAACSMKARVGFASARCRPARASKMRVPSCGPLIFHQIKTGTQQGFGVAFPSCCCCCA